MWCRRRQTRSGGAVLGLTTVLLLAACGNDSGDQDGRPIAAPGNDLAARLPGIPSAEPDPTPTATTYKAKLISPQPKVIPSERICVAYYDERLEFRETFTKVATMGQRYKMAWTAASPCYGTNTIYVYRVPRRSAALDERVRKLVGHRVNLVIVDTKYSEFELLQTQKKIQQRTAALDACGAHSVGSDVRNEGYLRVKVSVHPECARRVLADFADRIKIEIGNTRVNPV